MTPAFVPIWIGTDVFVRGSWFEPYARGVTGLLEQRFGLPRSPRVRHMKRGIIGSFAAFFFHGFVAVSPTPLQPAATTG